MSAPRVWRCVENETCTVLVGAATEDGAVSILTLCIAAPALLSIAKRWNALYGGSRHVPHHAQKRAELLADTRAAISAAEETGT
jgi:hypothetical protein